MSPLKDGLPGITRASFARAADEIVVRNRTRAVGVLVGAAAAVLALSIGSIVAVAHGRTHDAAIAVPIINVVMFYAGWLIALRTTIRLRAAGVVIENVFVRHTIPWRQGRQFHVRNGLRLRLLDGRTYAVWAFQGSLGAALIKYASFEPIVEQLTSECDRIVSEHPPEYPPPPTARRFQVPDWWVILVVAAATEAVVWIAYAIVG